MSVRQGKWAGARLFTFSLQYARRPLLDLGLTEYVNRCKVTLTEEKRGPAAVNVKSTREPETLPNGVGIHAARGCLPADAHTFQRDPVGGEDHLLRDGFGPGVVVDILEHTSEPPRQHRLSRGKRWRPGDTHYAGGDV